MGYGVSTCATCDGAFYRGKEVAVVGGGDSAVEEATFLTRFASKVTLIHRRDALRASKIMQDRLLANPKVEYAWNSRRRRGLRRARAAQGPKGVRLGSTADGSIRDLPIDGLFLAIGHVAEHGDLPGPAGDDPEGYLLTRTALAWDGVEPRRPARSPAQLRDGHERRGGLRRGDVVDTHYRQAITAAGSGCAAAMDCEKWLETAGAGH